MWQRTLSALRTLLLLGERLRWLLHVAAAVGAPAEDEPLELLQQELPHREIARVLVPALQLEGIALQVVELPARVRVLDQQVTAGADRAIAGRDDRARDLGGPVQVEVLDVGAEVNALAARGAHRRPRLVGGPRGPGLDQDRPEGPEIRVARVGEQ